MAAAVRRSSAEACGGAGLVVGEPTRQTRARGPSVHGITCTLALAHPVGVGLPFYECQGPYKLKKLLQQRNARQTEQKSLQGNNATLGQPTQHYPEVFFF